MRPLYFLKSFGLKQLETTRRDVLRKLASGNADEIREGMKQEYAYRSCLAVQ